MAYTKSFEIFAKELGQKLEVAQQTGMSKEQIVAKAADIGDWLANNYDPQSPEQRLLKEMWDVSGNQEQEAIAEAVVKVVGKHAKL